MRRSRRSRILVCLALALMLPALAGITGTAVADEATTDPAGSASSSAVYGSGVPLDGTDPADQPPDGAEDGIPVGGAQRTVGQPSGASITAAETAADATRRYFGSGPWTAIKNAAQARAGCTDGTGQTLTVKQLRAMVLATIFLESAGATSPSSIPAPMTLSRYDEWTGVRAGNTNQNANYGLYAFRDPSTAYKRAFWHPGIGIWQYDSAGLGAPYTAAERISTTFLAPTVAAGMASRYCASDASTGPGKRYDAWRPWSASCDSGSGTPNATRCEEIYAGLYQANFGNVTVQPGISATGGAVKHSCVLSASGDSYPCWRIDPSRAQGATWWATAEPLDGGVANRDTSPITPIAAPFYVIKQGGTERRYWLSADTGYARDITGTRALGKNARPKDNQAGSGVNWAPGTGLCDVTITRGTCGPGTPPAGVKSTRHSVQGTFQVIPADINGDRRDDLLFYAPGTGSDQFWIAKSNGTFSRVDTTINGTYTVTVADVDGNGRDDLVFYDEKSGIVRLWRSRGNGSFIQSAHSAAKGLTIKALDRNGDGRDELLLYGPGALPDAFWTWRTSNFAVSATRISGRFQVLIGDFDNNHRDDIFFYGPGTAADYLWSYGSGGMVSRSKPVNGHYHPFVGDLDGDAKADILWYRPGTAVDYVHFGGAGQQFDQRVFDTSGTDYQPVLTDLIGAGDQQILWYRPGSGQDYWMRWGTDRRQVTTAVPMTGTQTPIAGGFSANGADGLFWYRPGGLLEYLWYR